MNKIILILVLLLQWSYSAALPERDLVSAQISSFMKILGTPLTQSDISLVITSQGDYVIAATTDSVNNGDIAVVKTNAIGEIQWAKGYGGVGAQAAYKVVLTPSNTYLVFGTTFEVTYRQLLIVQMDQDGNQVTHKQVNFLSDISIGDVIVSSTGGYVLGVNLSTSFTLIKVNPDLTFVWEENFTDGLQPISVNSLVEVGSNDFAFCAQLPTDILYHRFTAIGSTYSASATMKRYSINTGDRLQCNKMIKSQFGPVVYFVGRVETNPHELLVIKLDISSLLAKFYITGQFNLREGYDLVQTSSGQLRISGYSKSLVSEDMALISTNTDGLPVSVKITGGTGDERGFGIHAINDGGFLMTVTTTTEGPGQTDLGLVKFQDDLTLCVYYDLSTSAFVGSLDSTSLITVTSVINSPSPSSSTATTPVKALIPLIIVEFNESTICRVFSQGIYEELLTGANAECLCSPFGQCNTATQKCECQTGYSGFFCQYTDSIYDMLAPQVQASIGVLQGTLGVLTDQEVLNDLTYITASPDFIIPTSALRILAMVAPRLTTSSPQSLITQAFQIYSKLSENARFEASAATIGKKLSQDVMTFLQSQVSAGTHPNFLVSKIQVDTNYFYPASGVSYSASDTTVQLSTMLDALQGTGYSYASAVFNENIYAGLAPTDYPSSPVVSVSILNSIGSQQKVNNLQTPIKLSFTITSQHTQLQSLLSSKSTTQIIQDRDLECLFYQDSSQTISKEGCVISSLTAQKIECECTHMTDFMVMLRSSYTTLTGSNYAAILALRDVTFESLLSNTGFYITIGYWTSFLILTLILGAVDRKKLRYKFYFVLWSYLQDNNKNKYEIQSDTSTVEQDQHTVVEEYHDSKKEETKNGVLVTIKRRFTQIYAKERSQSCSCPRISCKMAYSDLSHNNQICNLLCTTSPLRSRALRLSFFYFGLLLEISIAALFYDLTPSASAQSSSIWDGLIQNVFVALYSALFALFPLLILASLYCIPSKPFSQLKNASKQGPSNLHFQTYYKQLRRRLLCSRLFGGILFTLFSSFFCLYLIGFCQQASSSQQREWLISSFLSVAFDILFFELFPAFLIGLFSSLLFCCSRFSICLIVSLQFYRFLRNLADV